MKAIVLALFLTACGGAVSSTFEDGAPTLSQNAPAPVEDPIVLTPYVDTPARDAGHETGCWQTLQCRSDEVWSECHCVPVDAGGCRVHETNGGEAGPKFPCSP